MAKNTYPMSLTEIKVTRRERLFAEAFCDSPNPTSAIITAGYRGRHPKNAGQRLLSLPHVRRYIAALLRDAFDTAVLRTTGVIKHLADIARADPADLVNPDGTARALDEVPERTRRCIQRYKISPGNERISPLLDFAFVDKTKALQTLAEYLRLMESGADGAQDAIFELVDYTTPAKRAPKAIVAPGGGAAGGPGGPGGPAAASAAGQGGAGPASESGGPGSASESGGPPTAALDAPGVSAPSPRDVSPEGASDVSAREAGLGTPVPEGGGAPPTPAPSDDISPLSEKLSLARDSGGVSEFDDNREEILSRLRALRSEERGTVG